ncbi:MAG: rhodanese-related sulfurtransferase [Bacteroidetes bacterium]|nr:rhodanese-related sulfurtransferase [Bacteroidota bacterium]
MLMHNKVNREELKRRMLADLRPYTTISFYKYYAIKDVKTFRETLYYNLHNLGVVGRIYVADEGINAQISLPSEQFENFKEYLYSISFLNNIRLNLALEEGEKSFYKLDVKARRKIVADGIEDPTFNPSDTGNYLKAGEWNSMLEKPDVVVIDMRNHYESEVGRFENARCPDVDTFKEELDSVIDEFKEKRDQPILMYCTGGIRCEKASAWMKHNGFGQVYHLEGGIINYVNQVREQGVENKFHGVNFVFDQRLHERITDEVLAHCHQCGEPADAHVNCANVGCHLLFIQCKSCADKYQHCCSIECMETIALPEEEQKILRKGKPKPKIFSKGRFPITQ